MPLKKHKGWMEQYFDIIVLAGLGVGLFAIFSPDMMAKELMKGIPYKYVAGAIILFAGYVFFSLKDKRNERSVLDAATSQPMSRNVPAQNVVYARQEPRPVVAQEGVQERPIIPRRTANDELAKLLKEFDERGEAPVNPKSDLEMLRQQKKEAELRKQQQIEREEKSKSQLFTLPNIRKHPPEEIDENGNS